jgi:rhamnose transport system ATP-binding protein
MTEIILNMTNISKNFAGVQALHAISFELKEGEVHALLGENGAGKSTLVKVITGVYQPDIGEIFIDSRQVHFTSAHDSRQAGIAAIYQELSLFPDLDIAENIYIGRQPTRPGGIVDWRKMYRDSGALLDSLNVHMDLRAKASTLSIAQQQMVEIARALSVNARILIMDEPTSSLTLNEVDDLFRIVRQLRDAGTAIVFISHRLEELFELANRVTVLRDAAYVGTYEMTSITKDALIHLMVGRTITDLFPKKDIKAGDVVLQVDTLSRKGVFTDISFDLHKGEILGMSGLVGAGRTNVARALFGIEPATSGTIKINGKAVEIENPQQAMQLGLAYVPEDRQHHGLVLPLDITTNVTLPNLETYSRRGWLDNHRAQEASYAAASQMEVRANELSGGNQQKVVLAKWLSVKPRILILDEPTRGIDVGTKAAVHGLMSDLAAQGLAILMISSELPEILGMSDRILVLHEGRITGIFSRQEATQETIMLAATRAVGEKAA